MALLKVRFCSKLLEAGARDVCTMYNVAMVTGAELERRDRGLYPDSSLDEPESRHSRSSWPSFCQSRVTRIGQAAQAKQGRCESFHAGKEATTAGQRTCLDRRHLVSSSQSCSLCHSRVNPHSSLLHPQHPSLEDSVPSTLSTLEPV